MVDNKFADSTFRFTEPVRYFKASDPYYFEVDNIPIKQLEENCLWLRDQLKKSQEVSLNNDFYRIDFNELRPYANGTDRVIRVKPGRFSARINDVYSKQALQYFEKVLSETPTLGVDEPPPSNNSEYSYDQKSDEYRFFTNNDTFSLTQPLALALDKFKSNLGKNALGMTGLEERSFTWPVKDADTPINITGVLSDGNGSINYEGDNIISSVQQNPGLLSQALLWIKNNYLGNNKLFPWGETSFLSELPRIENNLIKKWRGVTRFAIVDVPEELTIEIPEFDSTDFNYIGNLDSDVESVVEGVETRIDLVFLYAKPVDASGARVVKNNEIVTITKPQLGVLRGAGIKFSEKANQSSANPVNDESIPVDAFDGDGNSKILASPGDQNNETMGFFAASGNDILQDVKGSFPAPDDLLNISPLLNHLLETEALELVGQTILPLAYVFVQKGDTLDSNGNSIVRSSDIIDIRPFFRTAELSYNERAGIAAAVPQLSLANPAVGKTEMSYEIAKAYSDLKQKVDEFKQKVLNSSLKTLDYKFLPNPAQVFEASTESELGIPTARKTWTLEDIILASDLEFSGDHPYDNIVGVMCTVIGIGATNNNVRKDLFLYGGPSDNPDYEQFRLVGSVKGSFGGAQSFIIPIRKAYIQKEIFVANTVQTITLPTIEFDTFLASTNSSVPLTTLDVYNNNSASAPDDSFLYTLSIDGYIDRVTDTALANLVGNTL